MKALYHGRTKNYARGMPAKRFICYLKCEASGQRKGALTVVFVSVDQRNMVVRIEKYHTMAHSALGSFLRMGRARATDAADRVQSAVLGLQHWLRLKVHCIANPMRQLSRWTLSMFIDCDCRLN